MHEESLKVDTIIILLHFFYFCYSQKNNNMQKLDDTSDLSTTRARDVPTSNTAVEFWENHVELMETYNPNQAPLQSGLHEMSVTQKNTLARIQLCAAHFNKQLEYFCVDHDVVCCNKCISNNHNLCFNVLALATVAKGASKSREFSDLNRKVIDVEKKMIAIFEREKVKNDNVGGTHLNRRHSFMDKLGKLSNLRKDSKNMRVSISKAKELREVFGFVEQSSVDIHAFLLKQLKKSEIAELESKIESKERNVKVSKLSNPKRLSFKRSQSHDLTLSFDETACITTTDNVTSFPKVDKALTFPSVDIACRDQEVNRFRLSLEANPKQTFKFLYDIDFKDKCFFSIYGMYVTEDNSLLFCDSNSHRILVFNSNDVFQYQIKTNFEPWDIAVIPGTHIAVTSSTYAHHVVQFIDISKKSFCKEVKIKRSEQGGIAIVNKSIFVGSESKVHVLDYKGHKMNKITGITGKSHYIHTCADNRIVIINETHVLLVSQDGIPDLSYFSPDMSSPGKPASDFYGNVYIPDLLSHNIYMLLTDSNTISAVLSDKDGIHFPTAVAIDRYGKKLYVANNSGNSVKVFAIQTS